MSRSDKPELLGFLGRPLSFMIKDSEALTTEKSLRCQADKFRVLGFRVLGWKACALLCSRSSTGGSANILILFAEVVFLYACDVFRISMPSSASSK